MKGTRKEVVGPEARVTRSTKLKLSKSPSPSKKLKSPAPTRKFFKSKAAGTAKAEVSLKIGKTTPRFLQAKTKVGKVSRKARRSGSVYGLKPTTSKSVPKDEPVSRRTLRPRKNAKNYCEDSKVASKSSNGATEARTHSSEVQKVPEGDPQKKAPIYKSARRTEAPAKGEAEVYEFLPEDEPSDRGRRKRKAPRKPAAKKPEAKPAWRGAMSKNTVKPVDAGVKRRAAKIEKGSAKASEGSTKKAVVVLTKVDVAATKEKSKVAVEKKNLEEKENELARKPLQPSTKTKETDNFAVPKGNGIRQPKVRREAIENGPTTKNGIRVEVESKPPRNEKVEEGPSALPDVEASTNTQEHSPDLPKGSAATPVVERENVATKPRIVSIEKLDDNGRTSLVPTPAKTSAEFRPFRTTNVFTSRPTIQYKNMLNHSLLNKSLSPIKKVLENFDAGSPWRPPVVPSFSQVRSLVQSTPQSNLSRITSNNKKKEPVGPKMNAIMENNENALKQIPVKTGKSPPPVLSPRKFGTVISNIDNNVQFKKSYNAKTSLDVTNNNNVPLRSEKSVSRNSVEPSSFQERVEPIESVAIAAEESNLKEDKENAAPNYQTPKTSPRKIVPPATKSKENAIVVTEENLEPQAGPSGLQKGLVDNGQRAGRQMSLNKFLGKPEMPESTSIRTSHGIFDDAHSTPIFGKKVKKVTTKKVADLANAFGFDEDESDGIDVSPIVPAAGGPVGREAPRKLQVPGQPRPNAKAKEKVQAKPIRLPVQRIQKKAEKVERVDVTATEEPPPKRQFDVVSFSDTFDVLSENGELAERKETAEVPLFEDLEPTHFNKPPRHSYKRKRAVKFSFSEPDSEEERDDEDDPKPERKKRRGRLNKEEEKKIKDWVKSINNTFQEIDQYDLVVE